MVPSSKILWERAPIGIKRTMKWQAANLHRFQEVCLMADPWKLTRLSSSKGLEISQKRAKALQEARAPTTNKERKARSAM